MIDMMVIVIKDDDGYDCKLSMTMTIVVISKMIIKDHIVSEWAKVIKPNQKNVPGNSFCNSITLSLDLLTTVTLLTPIKVIVMRWWWGRVWV